jgi:hypothetical protein
VYLTYRAQNDDSFARYERMQSTAPYRWRVRTTDGKVMTFGEAARMPGCAVSDQNAPLTGMVDAYGNEVSYVYQKGVANECVIASITWGQNASAGLASFANINFVYKTGHLCNGSYTNSQIDYRTGVRIVTGAALLQQMTITAYKPGSPGTPLHTRRITLDYDATAELCSQTHAPVRLLTSIQETASGLDSPAVTLPPVTFDYNPPGVTLMTPQTTGYASAPWSYLGQDYQNLGWGYRRGGDRWPSVESMFLDVDGDGLQDLVTNASDSAGTTSECVAAWHKNTGPDANGNVGFVRVGEISLPRLKWHGTTLTPEGSPTAERVNPSFESCALNGQVTAYRNAYGLPGVCHHNPGATCVSGSDPNDQNSCPARRNCRYI